MRRGSDGAAAVHAGAVAVLTEVAGAAIDVARAPSAERRQAGATGAVAEAALSIRGTGGSAVPAATAVPVAAGLTAAARLCGAAGTAPAGSAGASSDEKVAGARAAGFGGGAGRSLRLAAESPGDAAVDRLIALQASAALRGLAGNTRCIRPPDTVLGRCLAAWLPASCRHSAFLLSASCASCCASWPSHPLRSRSGRADQRQRNQGLRVVWRWRRELSPGDRSRSGPQQHLQGG